MKTDHNPNPKSKILPFKEQTVQLVTETCKRISFGLDLVKVKKYVFPKYSGRRRDENRRI